VQYQ